MQKIRQSMCLNIWKKIFSVVSRCNNENEWYQIHENIIRKSSTKYTAPSTNYGKTVTALIQTNLEWPSCNVYWILGFTWVCVLSLWPLLFSLFHRFQTGSERANVSWMKREDLSWYYTSNVAAITFSQPCFCIVYWLVKRQLWSTMCCFSISEIHFLASLAESNLLLRARVYGPLTGLTEPLPHFFETQK